MRWTQPGQTAFLALPDVSSLAYFPFLLPFERPLLLMRDGRDVASSMVRTWPEVPFDEACIRWNRGARIMMMQQKLRAKDGWKIFRYARIRRQPCAERMADQIDAFKAQAVEQVIVVQKEVRDAVKLRFDAAD